MHLPGSLPTPPAQSPAPFPPAGSLSGLTLPNQTLAGTAELKLQGLRLGCADSEAAGGRWDVGGGGGKEAAFSLPPPPCREDAFEENWKQIAVVTEAGALWCSTVPEGLAKVECALHPQLSYVTVQRADSCYSQDFCKCLFQVLYFNCSPLPPTPPHPTCFSRVRGDWKELRQRHVSLESEVP